MQSLSNPDDWEIVSEPENKNISNQEFLNPDEWELASQENPPLSEKESLGHSALMALPRVGKDLYTAGYQGIQNIPGYLRSAKTEIPGFFNLLLNNPERVREQGHAGLAELGHNTFNFPHDVVNYLSERFHLVPESFNKKIQMARMPEDTQEMINARFGDPQQEGEKFARGLTRNLINLGALTGITKAVNPSGFLSTKNSIKNTILKTHDTLENRAAKGFKDVSQGVNKRGITTVPIDQEIIQSLQEYFPKTKSANALLEKAKTGDYNALRNVQSDLYHRGKKNMGSPLEQERLRGTEMFEKRDEINQAISNHLKNTGHHDLDSILNKARADYRKLQEVYYNENMNNAIVNMVNKKYRKIPSNLIDVLKEESNPMKDLLNFHPGLEKNLSTYGLKKNALTALSKYGLVATAIGVGGALGGYQAAKYGLGKEHQF